MRASKSFPNLLFLTFGLLAAHAAAQTFTVLYRFSGPDGASPYLSTLTEKGGLIYGTTTSGGANNFGTVFSLTPPASSGEPWSEQVLYSFMGQADGGEPTAGVVITGSGALFGTATYGGDGGGTVFELTPPAVSGNSWTDRIIYTFPTFFAGEDPWSLLVSYDGVFYGSARYGVSGSDSGNGGVYSLSRPSKSGESWKESVIHAFTGAGDGSQPTGVIFDTSGNLYGGTGLGGPAGGGTVYELTPPSSPGGTWTEQILYSFTGAADGSAPTGPPAIGPSGVLYGLATYGGIVNQYCSDGCGVIYALAPPSSPGADWTEQTIYQFTAGSDGANPFGTVVIGKKGQLYGTASISSDSNGSVWELNPPASAGGSWTIRVLHNFTYTDGEFPSAGLLLHDGVLYGSTLGGGGPGGCPSDCGVVFSVAP